MAAFFGFAPPRSRKAYEMSLLTSTGTVEYTVISVDELTTLRAELEAARAALRYFVGWEGQQEWLHNDAWVACYVTDSQFHEAREIIGEAKRPGVLLLLGVVPYLVEASQCALDVIEQSIKAGGDIEERGVLHLLRTALEKERKARAALEEGADNAD